MKILGIDPGTTRIGYGLILKEKSVLSSVAYGVLEITSPPGPERIRALGDALERLLNTLQPDIAGVERLFFSKNRKTALAVSEARGVIILALTSRNIPITELRPAEIKSAVTGYALADKKAVQTMVKRILKLPELGGYDDASDALAIALATERKSVYTLRVEKSGR